MVAKPVIKVMESSDPLLEKMLEENFLDQVQAEGLVTEVLTAVRAWGDNAVCEYIRRFGGPALQPGDLRVKDEEIEAALSLVGLDYLSSLRRALQNITAFHRKQLQVSWFETRDSGAILGQLVRPLDRVGIYVPGGKASYPSSVLMNAVPARVAGVEEIAMVTPSAADGSVNPYTLAAAAEAGVREIYKIGGAQAIAALAFGTGTVPRVDKITGPGNIHVTLAKRQVYGVVDIDMLAGPSEILIIADDAADPSFIAADLLSQAEHDEMASSVLLTPCRDLALRVQEELAGQIPLLDRREIINISLERHGAIVITADLEQAFELAARFAPEHLELLVNEPFSWLSRVKNAGAVFLGPHSPEPVGDYLAGPNHVLPTGGTARFYSPLGVEAFLKKTSLIAYTRDALEKDARAVIKLAEVEGLSAHAGAVKVRLKKYAKEKGKGDE